MLSLSVFGSRRRTTTRLWRHPSLPGNLQEATFFSTRCGSDKCNVAGLYLRGHPGSSGRPVGAGYSANRRGAMRERRNGINIDLTLIAVIITAVAVIGSVAFFAGGIRQSVKDLDKRLTRVEIILDDFAKGVSRLTGMFETFIAIRSDNQAAPKADGKSDE